VSCLQNEIAFLFRLGTKAFGDHDYYLLFRPSYLSHPFVQRIYCANYFLLFSCELELYI
jgi:hypothetical protein